MIDSNTMKSLTKAFRLNVTYKKYLFKKVESLKCQVVRMEPPENDPKSLAEFRYEMPTDGWQDIEIGEKWGGDFCYSWFRSEFIIPKKSKDKKLLIKSELGEAESLLFINGKTSGLFDAGAGVEQPPRLHNVQPIPDNFKEGELISIVLEAYPGHILYGNMPFDVPGNNSDNFYPHDRTRVYNGLYIVEADEIIADFLMKHRIVSQIIKTSLVDSKEYAEAVNVMLKVFNVLPQKPEEIPQEIWYNGIIKSNEIMAEITDRKWDCGNDLGHIGIVGHSHLDTAWLWPVRETLHKAARTFSNALKIMDYDDDYTFIQSSVLHIDWMKKYYPDIYEGICKRTAEGRWEPNGGSWVECDNNIPGGEYMIRHFLKGQRYLIENLNYKADCFWQPDTFGYTAALPQIIKGCGMKYFLTTKLSWNETNKFPHDSFIWRGIDGSEVLTHFNLTHCWPDVETVRCDAMENICHKDVTDMKLIAYGFGDGGGGPSYSMAESAKRIKNLKGLPEIKTTTVSGFMNRLESTIKNPPLFNGELYLELHRGTLTQMHEIKKSNRLLEKAIRNLEIINSAATIDGSDEKSETLEPALTALLLNQFHDILPGTCISSVNDVAIYENYREIASVNNEIDRLLGDFSNDELTVFNTLSWERTNQIIIDDIGFIPENSTIQHFVDVSGNKKIAFSGKSLKPMSAHTFIAGKAIETVSPFSYKSGVITTPFATVKIDSCGGIVSYVTNSGYEVVRCPENPLNTLYMGEDVPAIWDNWDIDYDQKTKMKPQNENVKLSVSSQGALQLRIRTERSIGFNSSLIQDMVFYSDTPRIDFETAVDWNDLHNFLKAGFDVSVLSNKAKFETQFGHIERPTHENYATDKSQFEVCNHKWTDLSDNRFGVAILNDCKYGISVDGSDMRLSLHKSGTHPDPRGDVGCHSFTYSLLVHESGFNTVDVIRPAYELNYPVSVKFSKSNIFTDLSLFTVDSENVILETVKSAEDGNGLVVRLYETEGTHAVCELSTERSLTMAGVTDMLEYDYKELEIFDNKLKLCFKPFEIKTLRLLLK